MKLEYLSAKDLNSVTELFVSCFQDDDYYKKMMPNPSDRLSEMRNDFPTDIRYCLENGWAYGIFDNDRLIAFALLFDYKKAKSKKSDMPNFEHIFAAKVDHGHVISANAQSARIHERLSFLNQNAKIKYLLSIAVKKEYRHQKIATKLIDWMIADHTDSYLASDVSNIKTLSMYDHFGFEQERLAEDYYFVIHRPDVMEQSDQFAGENATFRFHGLIRMTVANTDFFAHENLLYEVEQPKQELAGLRQMQYLDTICFCQDSQASCTGMTIRITYKSLLQYQRYLNIARFDERVTQQNSLIYLYIPHGQGSAANLDAECRKDGSSEPVQLLFNRHLNSMIRHRQNEWNVIPDVFVSTAVSYDDAILKQNASAAQVSDPQGSFADEYIYTSREKNYLEQITCCQLNANAKDSSGTAATDGIGSVAEAVNTKTIKDIKTEVLLDDLHYRTYYEDGIPIRENDSEEGNTEDQSDDASALRKRIRRYYLGSVPIKITEEITVSQYEMAGDTIGQPACVDLILSVDSESRCAVFTWYSLSAPFLLSHLMDSIIRNQIYCFDPSSRKWMNMYHYIGQQFGLQKIGSPKIFVTIPEQKDCLTMNEKASILASETIYPDNENMGNIIDPEILSILESNHGLGQGQYDRAAVYAYSNVLLQFNPYLKKSVSDRLWEESVTQFYIESTLFEEAAILITDKEITNALFRVSNPDRKETIDQTAFLKQVSLIYDQYSKTIGFWNRQVKYPSSQASLDLIRKSFRVEQKLSYLKRDQEQLQTVFRTKSDSIDREESAHASTALAILAMLAVFSAWCDSFEIVSIFQTMFSKSWTSYLIQIILFVAILLLALRAFFLLFPFLNIFQKKDRADQ